MLVPVPETLAIAGKGKNVKINFYNSNIIAIFTAWNYSTAYTEQKLANSKIYQKK
jgi:hypothetical protein